MMGIFEQLDWLTKKVKQLCCIIENGGGGCGDCPVAVDNVTITGDGTIANPLVAVGPTVPIFAKGQFTPVYGAQNNCSPSFPNDFYYQRIGNTLFIWGTYEPNVIANGWEFRINNPPFISAFVNTYDVVGLSACKENPAIIDANPGTSSIYVRDLGNSIGGSGVYTFSCICKIP